MSVEHLAPMIYQILSAPDTDLSTVSAKRVRKQLVELDANITMEFIKENKLAIDALIGSVFENINNPETVDSRIEVKHNPGKTNGHGKRKREEEDGRERAEVKEEDGVSQGEDEQASDDEEDEDRGSHSPATPVPKKAKRKNTQGLTDEEYARQLSSEINQRPSRGGRKVNGASKKGPSRTPKKKKSRAKIEDSDDADEAEGSSPKKKTTKPRKKAGNGEAKGGFSKEFVLSEPLAALVGTSQLSRPQVVKKLWEYIKGYDRQNPKNRKEILCDDALKAVFNSDKIDMFSMNKVLGQHLYELES